jgi:hypothetical protein
MAIQLELFGDNSGPAMFPRETIRSQDPVISLLHSGKAATYEDVHYCPQCGVVAEPGECFFCDRGNGEKL